MPFISKRGHPLKGTALKSRQMSAKRTRDEANDNDRGKDDEEDSESSKREGAEETPTKKKPRAGLRKGERVKEPRDPPRNVSIFTTDKYELYDEAKNNQGTPITGPFKAFKHYDEYTVVSDMTINSENFHEKVPRSGVRLDDRIAGIALELCTAKELAANWPAEFDKAGMIRATRMPLGHAYKLKVEEGEEDVDGNPCEDPGCYYGWWRGLHCLMGEEGFEAKMYKIRPSFEKFKCDGIGFKVGFRAAKQVKPKGTSVLGAVAQLLGITFLQNRLPWGAG